MPQFAYKALAADGSVTSGEISANDRQHALQLLNLQGLQSFNLTETAGSPAAMPPPPGNVPAAPPFNELPPMTGFQAVPPAATPLAGMPPPPGNIPATGSFDQLHPTTEFQAAGFREGMASRSRIIAIIIGIGVLVALGLAWSVVGNNPKSVTKAYIRAIEKGDLNGMLRYAEPDFGERVRRDHEEQHIKDDFMKDMAEYIKNQGGLVFDCQENVHTDFVIVWFKGRKSGKPLGFGVHDFDGKWRMNMQEYHRK